MNLIKKSLSIVSTLLISLYTYGQESSVTIKGTVIDATTKQFLSNVSIEHQASGVVTITDEKGSYFLSVPAAASNDSVFFTHVGYKSQRRRVGDMKDGETILMTDFSIELKSITVNARTQNFKNLENSFRRIKGNLFACETETTNGMYSLFLSYLEDNEHLELLSQCNYDLSTYRQSEQEFYTTYTAPYVAPANKKDTLTRDYSRFPAVNIQHKAAAIYCEWLTVQYNSHSGKKKFKKVLFRLPTVKEWQIAALGATKFESWTLNENKVEVIIPEDSLAESGKGKKVILPVTDEFWYPWWNHYHYRKKATNTKNCYLGNFKARPMPSPCAWGQIPGYDGWTRMSITTSYFPNGFGLYDVVGNVAEMVDEKGKALGGSWDHSPEQSTIRSIHHYTRPSGNVGFRVFMEVIEE
jgi:formylglycine-generating enzyme required for sulfatase activity